MGKRSELYVIQEPEAPAEPNVVPLDVTRPVPREHVWRSLMRRLEKNPVPRKPGNSEDR